MTTTNLRKAHDAQRLRSQLLTGEVIRAIENGCIDALEIAEEVSVSATAVRGHLNCLVDAGRVIRTVEKLQPNGKRFIYSLPADHVSIGTPLPPRPLPEPTIRPERDWLVAAFFGPAPGASQ